MPEKMLVRRGVCRTSAVQGWDELGVWRTNWAGMGGGVALR